MAEEIFLNQMSTGAGSDIEAATDLARRMVCEYGMSRLGPLTFGKKEEQIFLGREIAQHRDFSEETARQIDLEVRRLIDEAYQSAHTRFVESNKDAMHRIAAALLERETIDAEEVTDADRGQGTAADPFRPGLAQRHRQRHPAAGAQAGEPRRTGLPGGLAFPGITPFNPASAKRPLPPERPLCLGRVMGGAGLKPHAPSGSRGGSVVSHPSA